MSGTDTTEIRSRMMSNIKGKHTKPEMLIRKQLHRRGLRYRLHVKSLPGNPDLVFPKYNAVIQVNGCFWHGHECSLFRWPSTHAEFWRKKIASNVERDALNRIELEKQGWRVLTLWECALKGKYRYPDINVLADEIIEWLNMCRPSREIAGRELCSEENID